MPGGTFAPKARPAVIQLSARWITPAVGTLLCCGLIPCRVCSLRLRFAHVRSRGFTWPRWC